MSNRKFRKTRKYPDMMGSIRKHKRDLKQAKTLHKYMVSHGRLYGNGCDLCVSEPICFESLIP